MNQGIQAALYARVSSDGQAKANTVASQISALLERAKADGCSIPEQERYVDDGYSGSSLVRPALERLRDQAAAGRIDRIYVLAPDRLARKTAHQAVLLDEFGRLEVEVRFLNQPRGSSPEEILLLNVQGVIAEYERAKILERVRRGKQHAARNGSVAVLSGAPYGYHYVTKAAGSGIARWEICPDQAAAVRRMFEWVGWDRVSLGEVARRLADLGIPSPTGQPGWGRPTIHDILTNPAYQGTAAFGRTRIGPLLPKLRPAFGRPASSKRGAAHVPAPPETWLSIEVPALVSRELFAAVQEQLRENQKLMRTWKSRPSHLLQGLVVCGQCGRGCSLRVFCKKSAREARTVYRYYSCNGKAPDKNGSPLKAGIVCSSRLVPIEPVEEAVWAEVKTLLARPELLEAEYQRRLSGMQAKGHQELSPLRKEESRVRSSITRLIDGFTEGMLEKEEVAARMKLLRQRLTELEAKERLLLEESTIQEQIQFLVGQFKIFASRVREGVESADPNTRQELIRTLVKRVEVSVQEIHVVFRVNSRPPPPEVHPDFLQHCPSRFSGP